MIMVASRYPMSAANPVHQRDVQHRYLNVVTAHLLEGGISADPEKSLDQVCATAVAAKIYAECVRYYPFVLGAQPVRMIDLAAFYAAVASEGALPIAGRLARGGAILPKQAFCMRAPPTIGQSISPCLHCFAE
jgi:hypothetical protein